MGAKITTSVNINVYVSPLLTNMLEAKERNLFLQSTGVVCRFHGAQISVILVSHICFRFLGFLGVVTHLWNDG